MVVFHNLRMLPRTDMVSEACFRWKFEIWIILSQWRQKNISNEFWKRRVTVVSNWCMSSSSNCGIANRQSTRLLKCRSSLKSISTNCNTVIFSHLNIQFLLQWPLDDGIFTEPLFLSWQIFMPYLAQSLPLSFWSKT